MSVREACVLRGGDVCRPKPTSLDLLHAIGMPSKFHRLRAAQSPWPDCIFHLDYIFHSPMHARRLALGLTRKTQCVEQALRPRHASALFSSSSTAASGPTQFYQNRQLELYAGRETKRLTLRQLVHRVYWASIRCAEGVELYRFSLGEA
jgi:hypothetical protein